MTTLSACHTTVLLRLPRAVAVILVDSSVRRLTALAMVRAVDRPAEQRRRRHWLCVVSGANSRAPRPGHRRPSAHLGAGCLPRRGHLRETRARSDERTINTHSVGERRRRRRHNCCQLVTACR